MDDAATVRVVSRRTVRPPGMANNNGKGCWHPPKGKEEEEVEVIHLTPWDLRLISIDHIRKGVVLRKPPAGGEALVDALASSFARALGRFYPFAGRLAAEERSEDGTVTLSLRCTGEGAELVHAAAPGLRVADLVVVASSSAALYPLLVHAVVGADAALEEPEPVLLPLVAAQVTELADGVFVGLSMNHSVGDGASFWHFFSTWSETHRRGDDLSLSTPAPVLRRWFAETTGPVPPIPLPFPRLRDVVWRRTFERATTTFHERLFTFSAASVAKLEARANDTLAGTAISSLHAVLAHLWRAVCRARRLRPEQSTSYTQVVGCRGRVDGVPPGYVGNAMVIGKAEATVGEVDTKGLGWTASLLTRAVAEALDEAGSTKMMMESLARWAREPSFTYAVGDRSSSAGLVSGVRDLAALDVFGNDFGWGKPLAVRSGPGNKADGKVTVFEGPERGGSISLEVCLVQNDALARLVADEEFMDAVA